MYVVLYTQNSAIDIRAEGRGRMRVHVFCIRVCKHIENSSIYIYELVVYIPVPETGVLYLYYI